MLSGWLETHRSPCVVCGSIFSIDVKNDVLFRYPSKNLSEEQLSHSFAYEFLFHKHISEVCGVFFNAEDVPIVCICEGDGFFIFKCEKAPIILFIEKASFESLKLLWNVFLFEA